MSVFGSTKIIENGIVFTGDRQNRAGQITILVQNGFITDVTKPAPVLKALYPSAEIIDAKGKIIVPGFIDAHHTGESFILRYLTANQPMAKWNKNPQINRALKFLQSEATYDDFLSIYRLSYYSALKSGITTLAEFGSDNHEHSFHAAVEAMQQTCIKGYIGLHNGDQIEAARKLNLPNIKFAVVIADEENLTVYNLQSTIRIANEFHYPIILHLGQTKRANDIIKKNFNKSITQLYSDYHLFDYPVQLLHLIINDEADWDVVSKSGKYLVLSPLAILNKETDLPLYGELIRRKVPIAIGSDWGVSNPIEIFQAYVTILKSLGLSLENAYELLALLTSNGANALGLQSEIGTIEVGKKADFVFINLSDFSVCSLLTLGNNQNMLESILQSISSKFISEVMVNGEFYVREGNLLTYSEEELAVESDRMLRKLLSVNDFEKDQESSPAPILKFSHKQKVDNTLLNNDIPFEEGFRIIKKESKQTQAKLRNDEQNETRKKLPDNVKRIFGEDDL